MKTFRVTLHRSYSVEIDARNEEEALQLTEFFVSTPRDASTEREKAERNFRIGEIELVNNEATEAEEITEEV